MSLSRFRRRGFALLAIPALIPSLAGGCYNYAPTTPGAPPTGERVLVSLTDVGTAEVARFVGPNVGEIEGRLTDATDSVLTVEVTTVRKRNGIEEYWKDEPVPIRRAHVATVGRRELSRRRTALAIGAATAAVGALVVLFTSGAIGGGSGRRGGQVGER